MATLQAACLAGLVLLLLWAAVEDLRTMEIRNDIPAGMVATFALFATAGYASHQFSGAGILWSVAVAAAILTAGVAAFAFGLLGGGDVKLLAAVSLYAGPTRLYDFLAITAVAAGALGLVALAGARIGRISTITGTVTARLRSDLPLGPAIAAGGLWLALSH